MWFRCRLKYRGLKVSVFMFGSRGLGGRSFLEGVGEGDWRYSTWRLGRVYR